MEEGSKPEKRNKHKKAHNLEPVAEQKYDATLDDEEDEVSSEEEEEDQFDINDSSPEADKAAPCITNALTPQEHAIGAEKARESRHHERVVATLKKDHRRSSKSRSRSRASNRYPPPPSQQLNSASPLRVGLDLPRQHDSGLLHAAQHGARDDIHSNKASSGKSRIPDRDVEEFARTPTATTLLHTRTRAHSRSISQDLQNGHRAFAVLGNDESDSNASDSDYS